MGASTTVLRECDLLKENRFKIRNEKKKNRKSCVVIFTETSFCAALKGPFPISDLKSESTSKQKLSKLQDESVLRIMVWILLRNLYPEIAKIALGKRVLKPVI